MSEPEGNELEISHAAGVSAKVCGTTPHGPTGLDVAFQYVGDACVG